MNSQNYCCSCPKLQSNIWLDHCGLPTRPGRNKSSQSLSSTFSPSCRLSHSTPPPPLPPSSKSLSCGLSAPPPPPWAPLRRLSPTRLWTGRTRRSTGQTHLCLVLERSPLTCAFPTSPPGCAFCLRRGLSRLLFSCRRIRCRRRRRWIPRRRWWRRRGRSRWIPGTWSPRFSIPSRFDPRKRSRAERRLWITPMLTRCPRGAPTCISCAAGLPRSSSRWTASCTGRLTLAASQCTCSTASAADESTRPRFSRLGSWDFNLGHNIILISTIIYTSLIFG